MVLHKTHPQKGNSGMCNLNADQNLSLKLLIHKKAVVELPHITAFIRCMGTEVLSVIFYTVGNNFSLLLFYKSRKENPQKLTQLSSRSHPRHLVGKRTAQTDTIIDNTRDSQMNSNFPYRWSPASLTFNNYFYLFLCLYIT